MATDHRWAVETTVSRLRARYTQLADADASTRRKGLEGELKQVMIETEPADRRRLVVEVMKRFPVWGESAPSELSSGPSPDTSREVEAMQAQLANPLALADRLAELASGMSPEDRARVSAKLAAAGLSKAGLSEAMCKDLRSVVGLGAEAPVDPERVGELCKVLARTVSDYESLIPQYWNGFSAQHKFDPTSLQIAKAQMAAVLTSTNATKAATELQERLRDTRKRYGLFINVIRKSAQTLYQEFWGKRFSPAAVDAKAKASDKKAGAFGSWEKILWETYLQEYMSVDQNKGEMLRQCIRILGDELDRDTTAVNSSTGPSPRASG